MNKDKSLKQFRIGLIDEFIGDQENPFLVKTVLRFVQRKMVANLSLLPQQLEVEPKSIESILDSLKNKGLIRIHGKRDESLDTRKAEITEDGARYMSSKKSCGFGEIPQWKELEKNQALELMKTVKPLCNFHYRQNFKISSKDLKPLKKEIYSAVEKLKAEEREYIHNLLNLPGESVKYGISFVEVVRPTILIAKAETEPEPYHTINISVNYRSLDEAFEKGADSITACLKVRGDLEKYMEKKKVFANVIEMHRQEKGYDANMEVFHCLYDVLELPLGSQQVTDKKIKEVLGKIRYYYPKHQVRE